ncbi:MAG: hypothetical protein WCJ09_01480 [Planctomycetota bacterium]
MKHWKSLVLFVGLLSISGCGPATSQVSGKVTFADGSPLPFGRVTFSPKSGSAGFWAPLTSEGAFVVDVEMAAKPGEYSVSIVGAEEPAFFETDATGANKQIEPPKPLIDAKYTKAATSPLTSTVKAGKNELAFKVEKLP